jgi:hypothetical protein
MRKFFMRTIRPAAPAFLAVLAFQAVIALFLAFSAPEAAAQAIDRDANGLDAQAILKMADSVLIPANAKFNWSLTVERSGEPTKENRYIALKKGDLKYLFYTYYPSASLGVCHMRIDSTIWMYFPLADSSYKESYKAAFLNSGLSYADVMYNELSRYYDCRLVSTKAPARGLDAAGTGPGAQIDCLELELSARKGADGYAKILTYLDPASYLPVKREYFTLSGERLKEIRYGGIKAEGAIVKAFSMEIKTAMDADETTRVRFWNMSAEKSMGEQYFSLNFIKTWQPEIKE